MIAPPRLELPLAASLALALVTTSPAAEASCGDFGGLGVMLVSGVSAGAAIVGGLAAPGVIVLTDETKEYPLGRNVLYSIGTGLIFTGLYAVVDLSTNCGISSELDELSFLVVPPAALGVSVVTALLLWLYADEREPPPLALGLWPREGGAEMQVGFRF